MCYNRPVKKLRQQIDEVNHQILKLLIKRQALVLEIAAHKKRLGLPLRDKAREQEMLEKLRTQAEELGLSPDFAMALFEQIFKEARRLQT